MERLTEKHYLGTDHYMKCSGSCNVDMDCIDCPSFDCLVERLAAYEDTGLEPEQCENAKAIIESAFSDDTSKAERIRELLKADRDGRLVVLPCKVGDKLWVICTCSNELECPALLSDVVCFPWCEYLEDGDGDATLQ